MPTENRITKDHIEARIIDVQYVRIPGSTATVCAITMANGYTAIGESACVDPANFDEELGRSVAFDNAFEKLWALEGYLLREMMMLADDAEVQRRMAQLEALDAADKPKIVRI